LTGSESILDDSVCVIRLRQDDEKAFNILFERYSHKLYRFAFNFLRSKEEAEEMVQEVFSRVWEKRHGLDEQCAFSGFVFSIAYRLALNQIRHRKYEMRLHVELKDAAESRNETEDAIILADLQNFSRSAIDRMPQKRRLIFEMVRDQHMSYKEVAGHLQISTKTVESQMTEALKFLRRFFSKNSISLFFIAFFL
jgi:RNA polymerase sigma-70 factor (family 1)